MKKLIILVAVVFLMAGCVANQPSVADQPSVDPCVADPYDCPGGISGR